MDYYTFYQSYIKYSVEVNHESGFLITDAVVKAAYRQYLITYFTARAAAGYACNPSIAPSQVCTTSHGVATQTVAALGW